jgi:hypothetical protein
VRLGLEREATEEEESLFRVLTGASLESGTFRGSAGAGKVTLCP